MWILSWPLWLSEQEKDSLRNELRMALKPLKLCFSGSLVEDRLEGWKDTTVSRPREELESIYISTGAFGKNMPRQAVTSGCTKVWV